MQKLLSFLLFEKGSKVEEKNNLKGTFSFTSLISKYFRLRRGGLLF